MQDEREPGSLEKVLADVAAERAAQDRTWGVQEFPDGRGPAFTGKAEEAKADCAAASSRGELTWRHVLTEEYLEALAESEPAPLRNELVQTAAVAVKWIQSLDRRTGATEHRTEDGGGRAEKLVRDRIPDLLRDAGERPEARVAEPGEYASLLRAKLYEEAGEYAASGDPAELADVLEVVHALAALHGMTPADLEARRAAKYAERGGFSGRIVLRLR
ncbi:nucleoside triphosphate pyrophosphohydrolase [Actinomadura opuntiae]|uniref:nucleoside triphosphate pyrophosphohydrolase n=1 Tax=Actinomadura sp. OS1-43 TaxID=604315 RepID=UPI00255AC327|nr:nucleoside triphosphate pyrophosphohydrolase [Actinomadura sp. OS1-43]MDL4813935.1 nucleoside triphosphate pyrophosphohydrolase [Actinomadura sp. OS1-43]